MDRRPTLGRTRNIQRRIPTDETILLGRGRQVSKIPRQAWEQHLSAIPQHSKQRLSFMSTEHHHFIFLWSEEHAREYRASTSQPDGVYLTLPQSAYTTPIVQGALFAFEEER